MDKIKLSAAITAFLTGLFGLLTAVGIQVAPEHQEAVREVLLLLVSLAAVIVPFIPSIPYLLRKKDEEGN